MRRGRLGGGPIRLLNLRAIPRVFVPGSTADGPIELPKPELEKLRKVLRLSPGAEIAVLPDDGTLIRCRLGTHHADPIEVHRPDTEPPFFVTLAQALPKGDKLDEIVRACTEIGVSEFIFFPSDRTVVRWDDQKAADRIRRLQTIAREAAEVCFRTRLPRFEFERNLGAVLRRKPEAIVLSEVEGVGGKLAVKEDAITIVVGPEGGWSTIELKLIGTRGVSLGPRVLRVDHAGPAAAAILLLQG